MKQSEKNKINIIILVYNVYLIRNSCMGKGSVKWILTWEGHEEKREMYPRWQKSRSKVWEVGLH